MVHWDNISLNVFISPSLSKTAATHSQKQFLKNYSLKGDNPFLFSTKERHFK